MMKLSKIYEPSQYESDIYKLWEQSGAFIADPTTHKEHFSIAMPPPNETGTLSLGHALFLTLQDIMARYNRLQGKDVLWLPGTDHAALAVNAIVEKKLAEEGTNKHEVGREVFLERTRAFVSQSRGTMLGQMRAMGASCDWSRLRYTLDPSLTRTVTEVFVKMYHDGLIYRGHRIVNWDPNLETNVSDDEVIYEEETTAFYTFKFGPFEIGTARPETKFADKYVVMHPDDKRYKKYKHGDTFEVEWINGPVVATVIKDESVDPSFGTGVMTITPWHSIVDFDIAERHGLDKVQVIDFHGKLLPVADEFAGMDIAEARPKIVKKLKAKGLLLKTDESYVHNIARNERGKGIIEPQIRLQWFIDVNKPVVDWKGKRHSLKEVLQSVIHDGDIQLTPARFEKTYFHWIDNLRDWCISRQIWWGHRIPAWYRTDTDGSVETYVGLQPPADESEGWNEWEQDPDTLDTWFSSALWTWSTLIDPTLTEDYNLSLEDLLAKSPDFQAYHPTSVLETGWDILFFWVARMILSTTYATGQVPFKTIYLHGLIRAEDGKKMSKSRPESIIDPLDVIPKYGTDALRMALIMGVSPGNDQNWGWSKVEANRNFCNKLWNIARYIEGVLEDSYQPGTTPNPQSIADQWVLQKLQQETEAIGNYLDGYRFSEAYERLYHFIWDDVADWYIEASKTQQGREVLGYVLESSLKLAHPFAPFVTETIWQTLYSNTDSLLITSSWPKPRSVDKKQSAEFEELKAIVSEVRAITRALGLSKPNLYYSDVPFLADNRGLLCRMAGLESVQEVSSGTGLQLTNTKYRCWLDVDMSVMKAYANKLTEQIAAQEKLLTQLQARLDNTSYIQRAPKEVVAETQEKLKETQQTIVRLEEEQTRFRSA